MNPIAKIVIDSLAEMKKKKALETATTSAQKARTIARLDAKTAALFSIVWDMSIRTIFETKDRYNRDWSRVHKLYQTELDRVPDIEIATAFIATIEAVVKAQKATKEWMRLNGSLPKQNNPEKADELKKLFLKQMRKDTGDDIERPSDMSDWNVDSASMYGDDFYLQIVEPICEMLSVPNVDADVPELFADALAVHEIVVPDALDKVGSKALYDALVSREKFVGTFDEFKAEYPTPKKRKDEILHKLLWVLNDTIAFRSENKKMFDEFIMREKLFEKFLKSQDRYQR